MQSVTVAAPGRVNLIGEHIDYSGFGVLPCAITRCVQVTVSEAAAGQPCSTRQGRLQCVQLDDPVKFTAKTFEDAVTINPHSPKHWTDYIAAIYIGIASKFPALLDKQLRVEVTGTVPVAAGLSSSSALVVAVALGLLRLLAVELDRLTVAEICVESEKLAGTAGGGMDQTCILLAREHEALHVNFFPKLSVQSVRVPGKFLAAHSLVEAAKALDAATKFNRRVLECRVAADLLGVASLKEAALKWPGPALLEKIEQLPDTHILPAADTAGNRQSSLQLDARLEEAASGAAALHPRRRARHVVTEAARVDAFIAAATAGDLPRMGALMDASDWSCQTDYDCSCPELVQLTACLRSAGALGARLTGAGWGGFAVALVPDAEVDSVIDYVKREFYAPRGITDPSAYLFQFEPAQGARVLD